MHGRYSMFEIIGQGRSGVVRRGWDHVFQRAAAVKAMADSPEARLEARLLGSLSHPNIGQFYDVMVDKGVLYLVMELGAGGTVRDRRLSLSDLIQIAREAGAALQYLHEMGLVHCDVKPSHLMYGQGGSVQLIDLGAAAVAGGPARGGTAHYMAPELKREPAAHPRLDVFGLGRTLLALARENGIKLPKGLRRVLHTAAAAQPERRYQSIAEFLTALEACLTPTGREIATRVNFLWAGVGAVAALVALVLGSRHGVYPPVFTLGIGPGVVALCALYSPLLALVALAVAALPFLAVI